MGAVDDEAPQEQHLSTSVRHSQHLLTDIDTLSETAGDKKSTTKAGQEEHHGEHAPLHRRKHLARRDVVLGGRQRRPAQPQRVARQPLLHPQRRPRQAPAIQVTYQRCPLICDVYPVGRCCVRNAAPGRLLYRHMCIDICPSHRRRLLLIDAASATPPPAGSCNSNNVSDTPIDL